MIRKYEYDRAVLLSDFLAKTKDILEEKPQASDIHFVPEINGYEITFKNGNHLTKISFCFEKKFSDKLKINFFEDKILKASFVSESKENNTEILSDIF